MTKRKRLFALFVLLIFLVQIPCAAFAQEEELPYRRRSLKEITEERPVEAEVLEGETAEESAEEETEEEETIPEKTEAEEQPPEEEDPAPETEQEQEQDPAEPETPEEPEKKKYEIRLILRDIRDCIRIEKEGKGSTYIIGNPDPENGTYWLAGPDSLIPLSLSPEGESIFHFQAEEGENVIIRIAQPEYAKIGFGCSDGTEYAQLTENGIAEIRFKATQDTDVRAEGNYSAAAGWFRVGGASLMEAAPVSGLPSSLYVELGEAYDTYSSTAIVNGHRGVYFFQPHGEGYLCATCGSTRKHMVTGTYYFAAPIASNAARAYLTYTHDQGGTGILSQRAQRALAWITYHGQAEYDWNRANGNAYQMADGALTVDNQLEAYTIQFLASWCCTNDGNNAVYGTVHAEDGAHALDFMFGSAFSPGLPASTKNGIDTMVRLGLAFADAHPDPDEAVPEYQFTGVYTDGDGSHQPILIGTFQGKTGPEPEVRGDLILKKTDEDGTPLAGVPFLIQKTDGDGNVTEAHVMLTGTDGILDTSRNGKRRNNALDAFESGGTWTGDTQAGRKEGVWFGDGEPDADAGALTPGRYRVLELQTPELADGAYEPLISKTVRITKDKTVAELPDMVNRPVSLRTLALVSGTEDSVLPAGETVSVTDTVWYENLTPGTEYILHTKVVLSGDPERVLAEGKQIFWAPKASADAQTASGTVSAELELDTTDLEGKALCVLQYLYKEWNGSEILLASHEDTDDEDQTLRVPAIGTSAVSGRTGAREEQAVGTATVTDTVTYRNLKTGIPYTVKGILMDTETGEPLKIGGKEVRSETVFTPEEPDGTAEVVFLFSASGLAGTSVTVFEDLYREDRLVVSHRDLTDGEQTIRFLDIRTLARDGENRTHVATLGRKTVLIDTVYYEGLTPGKTYTVSGTVMDASTVEPVVRNGKIAAGTVTFTPEEPDGKTEVAFTLSTAGLEGKTLVIYEQLYAGEKAEGTPVAVHADPEDEGQTIRVPENPHVDTGDGRPVRTAAALTMTSAALLLLVLLKVRSGQRRE